MEAVECGAASLAMVLGYYGRFIPLEKMRVDVGVSRDGSKADRIKSAAELHGLACKGMRREINSLRSEAMKPSILFWGFGHFVVFEGMKGNKFRINDPAMGHRLIDEEEFNKQFTGITLEFEPKPDFKPQGHQTTLMSGFMDWTKGSVLMILFPILCGGLIAIPGLVIPGLTSTFINKVVVGSNASWTASIVIAMSLALVLTGVLSWLQQYALARLQIRLFLIHSMKMGEHLIRLPMQFFLQRYPGDIVSRFVSNLTIANNLTSGLTNGIVQITTALIYAIAMIAFNWLIGLLAVLATVLLLGAVRFTNRRVIDSNNSLQQEIGRQYGALMMMLRTMPEIKATSREMDVFSVWAGYQAKSANAQQRLSVITAWLDSMPTLVRGLLLNVFILTFGSFAVIDGTLSLGGLIALQMLGGLLINPVQQIVMLARTLQTTRADLARVADVLHYEQDEMLGASDSSILETDQVIRPLAGHVEFKDVCFGYDHTAPPLIKDLCFEIKPGSQVAIVGETGSGKSTVANLLLGISKPWSGEVRIDGLPLLKIPNEQRVNSISGVSQNATIFNGSIRDNVTLWDVTISDDEIVAAMTDASCAELLERPGGLDCQLAENGRSLSGGQQQRLEISRCLARNPSLLVLDGATSALDAKTESHIDSRLRSKGCTILQVSNRLNTVRDADLILVMDKGLVVEQGTHAELIEKSGAYAKLVGGLK